MRKCFSMLLGAGIIALLTSCNFVASPNDGTFAKDGLDHYVDWSNGDNGNGSSVDGGNDFSGENTTDLLWNGWAPFWGVQFWGAGPGETWGQMPDFSAATGELKASSASPNKFCPVFGAFNSDGSALIGTYDLSSVKTVRFKIKANKAGGQLESVFEYFGGSSGTYKKDAAGTVNKSIPTTEETISFSVSGGTSDKLFGFCVVIPSANYVVTITGIEFLDAQGNQIKDLPMTPND